MAAASHEGGSETALEMTRILLDAGADAGFVGPAGTALHAAAASGRSEVVSALIEVGWVVQRRVSCVYRVSIVCVSCVYRVCAGYVVNGGNGVVR